MINNGGDMTKKKEQKQEFGPLFLSDLLENFIGLMRKILSVNLFNFLKKWILLIGQWSFYFASGTALLLGIIGAIRIKSSNVFFTALAFSIGFFVVQYIGNKFLNAGDILIEENPTAMSSAAFLDSFSLLAIIGGAGILLFHLYFAIKYLSFSRFLFGIVGFVILWFMAFILMNPKEISVNIIKKTTAGQEAIGIITLFIKAIMKIIPIAFGVGLIYGTVSMFIHMFGLFKADSIFAWLKILADMNHVCFAGLLPLFAYLVFLISFLFIDIIRAVLSVPEKLEKLIKK